MYQGRRQLKQSMEALKEDIKRSQAQHKQKCQEKLKEQDMGLWMTQFDENDQNTGEVTVVKTETDNMEIKIENC